MGEHGQGALRLSVPQMALLTSGIFWGALVGTLLWGVISDVLGRRKAIVVAMAFCGGFGLLSAFCGSFGSLLFLRVLVGVGVGGSVPVAFSYLVRRCPPSPRSTPHRFSARRLLELRRPCPAPLRANLHTGARRAG